MGGTSVNVGCVASKSLMRGAEALHRAAHLPAFAGNATSGRLVSFILVDPGVESNAYRASNAKIESEVKTMKSIKRTLAVLAATGVAATALAGYTTLVCGLTGKNLTQCCCTK